MGRTGAARSTRDSQCGQLVISRPPPRAYPVLMARGLLFAAWRSGCWPWPSGRALASEWVIARGRRGDRTVDGRPRAARPAALRIRPLGGLAGPGANLPNQRPVQQPARHRSSQSPCRGLSSITCAPPEQRPRHAAARTAPTWRSSIAGWRRPGWPPADADTARAPPLRRLPGHAALRAGHRRPQAVGRCAARYAWLFGRGHVARDPRPWCPGPGAAAHAAGHVQRGGAGTAARAAPPGGRAARPARSGAAGG